MNKLEIITKYQKYLLKEIFKLSLKLFSIIMFTQTLILVVLVLFDLHKDSFMPFFSSFINFLYWHYTYYRPRHTKLVIDVQKKIKKEMENNSK